MGVRRVVGCMSGSSLDGLDVALVEMSGRGFAMRSKLIRFAARPLGELGEQLRRVADQQPMTAGEITHIARDFSVLHAEAVRAVLQGERADLIAVHGQTVYHAPPWSWQLFQAAPLVQALRIPVVYDLRAADIAAGGQGAPMTPIADFLLYSHPTERRAVVNLGGFANYTVVPPYVRPRDGADVAGGFGAGSAAPGSSGSPALADVAATLARVRGADVCACNQLLNAISRRAFQEEFDVDGRRAAEATSTPALRTTLGEALATQAQGGRSLGTGDECGAWIERHLAKSGGEQMLRAAVEEIAKRIGFCLGDQIDRVILAGGGARNRALAEQISRAVTAPVQTSCELGVPVESREAIEMAILGALAEDRVPIMLRQITHPKATPAADGVWVFP